MITRVGYVSDRGFAMTTLRVAPTDRYQGGRRVWKLLVPLEMRLTYPGGEFLIVVPAGFETDFASVPRLLWWLYPHDEIAEVAVIHDWLYRETNLDRFFCDAVLRLSMRLTRKRWSMCVAYFWAVRLCGWLCRVSDFKGDKK